MDTAVVMLADGSLVSRMLSPPVLDRWELGISACTWLFEMKFTCRMGQYNCYHTHPVSVCSENLGLIEAAATV